MGSLDVTTAQRRARPRRLRRRILPLTALVAISLAVGPLVPRAAAQPAIKAPKTVDFGIVSPGGAKSQHVKIRNTGDQVLSVKLAPPTGGPFAFKQGEARKFDIGPGDKHNVTLICSGTGQPGFYDQGKLVIKSNDPALPKIRVKLTCAVEAAGAIAFLFGTGHGFGAAFADSQLLRYTVGADGALTSLGPMVLPVEASNLAVHPNGKTLYVEMGGAEFEYAIGGNGSLRQVGFRVTGGRTYFTVEPTGRFGYASSTSSGIQVYAIDDAGILGVGKAAGPNAGRMVFDPSGASMFAVQFDMNFNLSVTRFSINQTDGTLSQSATVDLGDRGKNAISIDASGKFIYIVGESPAAVLGASVADNGALTALAPVNINDNPLDQINQIVATDPAAPFAFALLEVCPDGPGGATCTEQTQSLAAVDLTIGSGGAVQRAGSVPLGPATFISGFSNMVIEPAGKFAYVATNPILDINDKVATPSKIVELSINGAGALAKIGSVDVGSLLVPDLVLTPVAP